VVISASLRRPRSAAGSGTGCPASAVTSFGGSAASSAKRARLRRIAAASAVS
jgi:hypothetical protein